MEKNNYFCKFSKDAQNFFVSNGFVPRNDFEATNFINSLSETYGKLGFNVFYKNGKKQIFIDDRNYKLSLYPRIWKNLSVEQKTFVVYKFYKEISKEFGVSALFYWTDKDLGTNGAQTNRNKNTIFIGFDNLFIKNGYSGINTVALIAHELNHVKQNVIAQNIIRSKKNEKTSYEKGLFFYPILDSVLSNEKILKDIDDIHSERLKSNQKLDSWYDFIDEMYFGNYAEMSSGSLQKKYFQNLLQDVFSAFKKDYKDFKIATKYYEMTCQIYSKEKANKIFFGNTEFVNEVNQAVCYYNTQIKNINFLSVLSNDSMKTELENQKEEFVNKRKICIESMIDLFYFKKKPRNFDESIFKDIDKSIDEKII